MSGIRKFLSPSLFSFKGRSPRKEFWTVFVGTQLAVLIFAPMISMLAYLALAFSPVLFVGIQLLVTALLIALQVGCLYAILAVIFRRTHDLDMPGGFGVAAVFVGPLIMLLLFAGLSVMMPGPASAWVMRANSAHPLIMAALFLVIMVVIPVLLLGCFRGTTGSNQYGADPLNSSTAAPSSGEV